MYITKTHNFHDYYTLVSLSQFWLAKSMQIIFTGTAFVTSYLHSGRNVHNILVVLRDLQLTFLPCLLVTSEQYQIVFTNKCIILYCPVIVIYPVTAWCLWLHVMHLIPVWIRQVLFRSLHAEQQLSLLRGGGWDENMPQYILAELVKRAEACGAPA